MTVKKLEGKKKDCPKTQFVRSRNSVLACSCCSNITSKKDIKPKKLCKLFIPLYLSLMGFALIILLSFPALGAVCMFSRACSWVSCILALAPQGQMLWFLGLDLSNSCMQFPAKSLNGHGKHTFSHKTCMGNFIFNHLG